MLLHHKPLAATAAALSLFPYAHAHGPNLLVGYGAKMYELMCAWGCRQSLPYSLDCPEYANMTEEERAEAYPSAACYAQDKPYLTSIALCVSQRCEAVLPSEIDKFWEEDLFYEEAPDFQPELNYQQALALLDLDELPEPFSVNETVFNRTVSIDDDTYISYYNAMSSYSQVATYGSLYAILVFLSGICVPVGFTIISLLPWPAKWVSTFNAYFIDPPVFGKRHSVPVLGLAMVPTRGQALFILYLIMVNCIGNFHGYPRLTPNAWYPERKEELIRHIANRAGDLCFANIPLVFLYAGRNSLLLWITNWSHGTFLLVHRWIAFICTFQACLHSAMWLHLAVKDDWYNEAWHYPYWYWGIIGTMGFTLLIPFSILPIRKYWYELFLIGHIVLAIVAIVGAWYHIVILYEHTDGFDIWLYTAMGIWGTERVFRFFRVAKRGVKRAYVHRIDDEYIRVDIPGVDCSGYCYAYFPTLSWRIWENHPFSVVGSNPGHTLLHPPTPFSHSDSDEAGSSSPQLQLDHVHSKAKEAGIVTRARSIAGPNRDNGMTLFIRPHNGLTKLLASKCGVSKGIPIMVEGAYGHEGRTMLQGAESKFAPTPEFPNVLCIAGGVGITAVLPALNECLSMYGPMGSTKLYWGIRNRGLVDAVEGMLLGVGTDEKPWGHIEPHITVGSRINVRQVLEEELGESTVGTTVIVCGPLAMCDEVRYTVAAMARHGKTLRFVEESIPW